MHFDKDKNLAQPISHPFHASNGWPNGPAILLPLQRPYSFLLPRHNFYFPRTRRAQSIHSSSVNPSKQIHTKYTLSSNVANATQLRHRSLGLFSRCLLQQRSSNFSENPGENQRGSKETAIGKPS
ncbi:hypothetical protein Drorol1_Dr00026018 [Drosera rotundifolia]